MDGYESPHERYDSYVDDYKIEPTAAALLVIADVLENSANSYYAIRDGVREAIFGDGASKTTSILDPKRNHEARCS